MIILFRNQETACLNELTNRFPELLATAQISLSSHSQSVLLELVKARVKSNYFPSIGDSLTTLFGAILLVPLMVKLGSNQAVSTLDTHSDMHSTPELKSLDDGKINLLDGLIHVQILEKYRDRAEEARIQAESEQRRRETHQTLTTRNRATNVTATQPTYVTPRQLPQYNSRRNRIETIEELNNYYARRNGQPPRNNQNNARNDNNQLHLFGYVLMAYGLVIILQIFYQAWQAEQKNLGTCPAPRI